MSTMVESNKTRDLELIERFKSGDESAYEEVTYKDQTKSPISYATPAYA